MDEVKERGERVIKADVLAAKHRFNARQKSALRFLLEHGKITIQDFEALCPKANRRSLQRDLQGLVKARLVAASGATNLLEYRLL